MKSQRISRKDSQRGVALLIAIFAMLLISGIGISLVNMAGMESVVNANYRFNTMSFYAAQAGLEEVRLRTMEEAPNSLLTHPFFPQETLPVPGQVLYLVNPSASDPAFTPNGDPNSIYYDIQYADEFEAKPPSDTARLTASDKDLTQAGGLPPLPYKWVRVTLKSEWMAGIDLDGNGVVDPLSHVCVDGYGRQFVAAGVCTPDPNVPITSSPVYRITSFALDVSGARRMLQAEIAKLPVINPGGAIASRAGVDIKGNFNAFGAYPPIVMQTCGTGSSKKTIPTCGKYGDKGKVVGDCNVPYDSTTGMCGTAPNQYPLSKKDYCGTGDAVDGVTSEGGINPSGNYSTIPSPTQKGCDPNGAGCIYTTEPQKALDPNVPDWPYDMDELVEQLRPPVTEPIQTIDGVRCGDWDEKGNRKCSAQGVKIGTLPSTWPPPPNVKELDNKPKFVFADVGKGGILKLTGASSGSGILVVEGDLEVQAGFQWYGLIIVRGVVTFLGGGSTPTNVFGGVLAGTSVTNENTTAGGSVSVTYSSCAYRFNDRILPLRYISFREINLTR
jgi:hypothetical protein